MRWYVEAHTQAPSLLRGCCARSRSARAKMAVALHAAHEASASPSSLAFAVFRGSSRQARWDTLYPTFRKVSNRDVEQAKQWPLLLFACVGAASGTALVFVMWNSPMASIFRIGFVSSRPVSTAVQTIAGLVSGEAVVFAGTRDFDEKAILE